MVNDRYQIGKEGDPNYHEWLLKEAYKNNGEDYIKVMQVKFDEMRKELELEFDIQM